MAGTMRSRRRATGCSGHARAMRTSAGNAAGREGGLLPCSAATTAVKRGRGKRGAATTISARTLISTQPRVSASLRPRTGAADTCACACKRWVRRQARAHLQLRCWVRRASERACDGRERRRLHRGARVAREGQQQGGQLLPGCVAAALALQARLQRRCDNNERSPAVRVALCVLAALRVRGGRLRLLPGPFHRLSCPPS